MAFPTNPVNNQRYKDKYFNSALNSWRKHFDPIARVDKISMSTSFSHQGGEWLKLPFNTNMGGVEGVLTYLGSYNWRPTINGWYRISTQGYTTSIQTQDNRYAIGVYKNDDLQDFGGGNYNIVADNPLASYTGDHYFNGTTDYFSIKMYSSLPTVLAGSDGSQGHLSTCSIELIGTT